MAEKSPDLPVRIIGSRELHQKLTTTLRELQRNDVRYVLTVHGKPRAVLVGAEPYMNLVLDRKSPSGPLVALQPSPLLARRSTRPRSTTWRRRSAPGPKRPTGAEGLGLTWIES